MDLCSTPNQVNAENPHYKMKNKNKHSSNKDMKSSHNYPTTESLDYRWYARVYSLLSDFVFMESALAWLNTIGGAYSSLGERSKYHAKVAHNIAIKQLAIANKLNDTKLMTQCNLYMAFGLLQQHKYKSAQSIIADQMKSSNVTGRRAEEKLYQMCMSATQRLKICKRKTQNSQNQTNH
ncbi:hypothetical protein LOD99_1048 [Oopsacas minuta]|uniref:Uncharacterized protein n=1 Tax=Oopsacas minuta TaxID=111878 RepID=A0AAV7K1S3_9METZ|nr:hypothetical protein LOD99_1048 [Oopsacas minuta]